MFVFRNNTIERFFPKDYSFSGYDDISFIPEDASGYVWFYQLPIKFDSVQIADEVGAYSEKLKYVLSRIPSEKMVVALTMVPIYTVPFTESDHAIASAISSYNAELYSLAAQYSNLKILDFSEFTSQYPASDLLDWRFYFISQMGLNPRLFSPFMAWWQKKLDVIALKRKKCLVLDLDNTLWGGVLGEDGIDGIKIGGDYPGKAFLYFQEALLELSKSGVILTICSKNNEADVMEAFEKNPFMILKKDNFAAWRINWQDKASNVQELAAELNIGLDSFVFVDDNPSERELIKQMLPSVEVPDFPAQPYELPMFFKSLVDKYFKVYSVTSEDIKKTEQYKANAARANAQKSFADFDEFLKSLDIHLVIEQANEFNIPRIAQMTQKTNQFNLTTHRYTDADIRTFLAEGSKVFCISVSDKFGDSGITGCAVIRNEEIDTFLLSCRILGKGIEQAFLKKLLSESQVQGRIKAKYIPTAKNAQVKDFYDRLGFTCVKEGENGEKDYELNLSSANLEIKPYYNITIK